MYANAQNCVHVGDGYSYEFFMWSVFTKAQYSDRCSSSLCFEALSGKLLFGVLREDLYADDLVIINESLEKCVRRLFTWKEAMEKGLRVNAGKTKIMICGTGMDFLQN